MAVNIQPPLTHYPSSVTYNMDMDKNGYNIIICNRDIFDYCKFLEDKLSIEKEKRFKGIENDAHLSISRYIGVYEESLIRSGHRRTIVITNMKKNEEKNIIKVTNNISRKQLRNEFKSLIRDKKIDNILD